MKSLKISNFPFFRDNADALIKMNNFISSRTTKEFMPHEISSAIGCDITLSTAILLKTYAKGLAKSYLVLYHYLHPEPVMRNSIEQGFPIFPMTCDGCEDTIEEKDVYYQFLFILNEGVLFI